MKDLTWSWIGRVPYRQALDDQHQRRDAVINGEEKEIIWMLEHEPVITTGRRSVPGLVSKEHLLKYGIDQVQTERGGLATYHGPGQLIAYPIIDCWERGMGARGAVHAMEQSVIDWLDSLRIQAVRRPGFPGVWVKGNKICAIGMHFKKGVSIHGIAINLSDQLEGFNFITPCGITDAGITSVHREGGLDITAETAAPLLATHIVRNLLHPTCTMKTRSPSTG